MNPLSIFPKHAMRALLALVTAGTLLVAAGCGGGGNNGGGGGGGGGGNGSFTNASLKGQYAFTLRGLGTPDLVNGFFFVEGGVFTSDGAGHLTAITDDFIENFTQSLNIQTTGTYFINTDGSGELTFNFGSSPAKYRVTLSDASHFYMVEDEGFNTSAGTGEKQDTTAFAAVPSGTFVVQTHDLVEENSKVGVMTINAGQISGTGDVLSGGTLTSPVTLSGTAQAPGTATGRGTVTIVDDTGTSNYVYYVVNSRKLRLLNADAATSLGLGQAEAQTGGPFTAASLNGGFVFGSAGETTFVSGIHSVGLFAADGAGHITAGSFDFVQDGTPTTGVTLAANPLSGYTVDSSGRAIVDLNLSTGLTNEKRMFLVSPSRAYFLVNDPINVEDGILDKQAGTFSNSSLNGQASFFMDGFDASAVPAAFKDRVGTLTPNGAGSVRTDYRTSFFDPNSLLGGFADNTFTGSYSVDANGRATAQFSGFTNNMIYYLSSTNAGYFLQADNAVDVGGALTNQPAP